MSADYQLEDTIYKSFTTRAFATGIPTTLAGTPAIDIYEDDTVTPIITAETVSIDHNSVTGQNVITITATAASGFNAGGSYFASIQAGTVGGVSVVGEIVAEFTLDMSAAAKDLANVTDGLGALKTGIDAIPTTAMRGTDGANTTTPPDVDAISDGVWDEVLTGATHNVNNSSGKKLRQLTEASLLANGTIAVVTDAKTFTLDAGAVATTNFYINARLRIATGTGAGQSRIIVSYSSGRVAIVDSDFTVTPDTSSEYAIVSADAHASTGVSSALVDIHLDHLMAVAAGDVVLDGSVIAHMVSATEDWSTFDPSAESLEALRSRGDAAWTTGSGTGLTALASGTAQGGTSSTIQLASGETFADNVLRGNSVKITAGTGNGQSRVITANTLADDTCAITPDWLVDPSSDSVYEIVNGSSNISAVANTAQTTTFSSEVFTYVIENSVTFEQQMRLITAAVAGKVSVSGLDVTFRSMADDKNRMVSSTTATGERTVIVLDLTA